MKKIIIDKSSLLFNEDDYQRSCASKIGYDSPWYAQYAIDELQRFKKIKVEKYSFYHCPYCNKYHITSN